MSSSVCIADSMAVTTSDQLRDQLRDQLVQVWRDTVNRLTTISVELYGRAADFPDDPALVALDNELDSLRGTLAEVEHALRRLG
jgi:hypothetical protein